MERERAIEAQVDQDMVAATVNNGHAGSYSSNSDPLLVARSSLESVKGDMYVCMYACMYSVSMYSVLMYECICMYAYGNVYVYNNEYIQFMYVCMYIQDLSSYIMYV